MDGMSVWYDSTNDILMLLDFREYWIEIDRGDDCNVATYYSSDQLGYEYIGEF